MGRGIYHGMAASALAAAMALPICTRTAYADTTNLVEMSHLTPDRAATEAAALSEGVALMLACATLARRRHGNDDETCGSADACPSSRTATDVAGKASLAGEASPAGSRQAGQAEPKTPGVTLSRLACASWVMCQALKWLMPLALIAVWATLGISNPGMTGSLLNLETWALANALAWIPGTAFSVLYAHRCSRLSKELLSSVDRMSTAKAKSLLRRHWLGVALFSGGLLTGSLFLGNTYFMPVGLPLHAAIILMSSAPFVAARLSRMDKTKPIRPVWRVVLHGTALAIVTLALSALGTLAFVALMSIIVLVATAATSGFRWE